MKDTIISIHVNGETKRIKVDIKGESNAEIRATFALLATEVMKALNNSPKEFLAYIRACLAISNVLDLIGSRDKREVKLNDDY